MTDHIWLEEPLRKELLSIPDVAHILGKSHHTVRNQVKKDAFPIRSLKVGGSRKFLRRDVEKFLNNLGK